MVLLPQDANRGGGLRTQVHDMQTKQARQACTLRTLAALASSYETMAGDSNGLHRQAPAIGRPGNQRILRRNHGGYRPLYQVRTVHTVPRDLDSNGVSSRLYQARSSKSRDARTIGLRQRQAVHIQLLDGTNVASGC